MSSPERGTQGPNRAETKELLVRTLEEGLSRSSAGIAASVYRLSGDCSHWRPFLSRFTAHAAVLAVALLVAVLSSIEWPAQAASTVSVSAALPEAGAEAEVTQLEPVAQINVAQTRPRLTTVNLTDIARRPNPHTTIPKRPRLGVITYTVRPGDTIQSIAAQFDLDPTTISWANPAVEDTPDLLRIGQELAILPIDGVYHRVEEGDTLASIAEAYATTVSDILGCQYNDLTGATRQVQPDTYLIVPGGEKPYEPKKVTAYAGPVPEGARGTGAFQWPVSGMITQGYWYGHRAIDIGAPTGSAVLVTDGGFVSFAGWTDVGYGYLVVVDHANGFATYYAHLSNIYVAVGQGVRRGQVIAAVGNTGNSTGPHLHFEIRRYNTQQNPLAYLP